MERRNYIGSSDARNILSGDWDKLWRRKMGLIPEDDLSDSFAVQFGIFCEEFHLDWTIRRLNEENDAGWEWSKGPRPGDQHFAQLNLDTEHKPRLGSHPDALVRQPHAKGVKYPLEAKLTGRWKDAEEAADFYMPQLQHHMLCWDIDLLLFSVVIGTNEPVRMWIGASPEWQDHYIERCDTFWSHVVNNQAPSPAFFDHDKAVKVPTAVKDSVPINGYKKRCLDGDNRAPGLIAEFVETKKAVKRHDEVKNTLKSMMQPDEAEIYTSDGNFKAKRDANPAHRSRAQFPDRPDGVQLRRSLEERQCRFLGASERHHRHSAYRQLQDRRGLLFRPAARADPCDGPPLTAQPRHHRELCPIQNRAGTRGADR